MNEYQGEALPRKKKKVTTAAYRKISIEIARDIVNGTYVEGQKLFGRSALASQYEVSPETIRKAVFLLKDVGVVITEKGSGIEVVSVTKAKEFVEGHEIFENASTLRREVEDWAGRLAAETSEMMDKINILVSSAGRMRSISPIKPYEIRIPAGAPVIGKTVNELHFWHNTGATIVAIERGEQLVVSPGPYATFCENDVFYVVGNEEEYAAVMKMIKD